MLMHEILARLDQIECKLDLVLRGLADERRLIVVAAQVRHKTNDLRAAIVAAFPHHPVPKGTHPMSVPVIDDLVQAVAAEDAVVDSAIALIGGFSARLDAAVADALKNGATAAELAPLTTLSADVKAKTQALADAVQQQNTPPTP